MPILAVVVITRLNVRVINALVVLRHLSEDHVAPVDLRDLADKRVNQDIAIVENPVNEVLVDPKVVEDYQDARAPRVAEVLKVVAVNVDLVALKDQRVNLVIATVENVDLRDLEDLRVNQDTATVANPVNKAPVDLKAVEDCQDARVLRDVVVLKVAVVSVDLEDLRVPVVLRANRVIAIAVNLVNKVLVGLRAAEDYQVAVDLKDAAVLRDAVVNVVLVALRDLRVSRVIAIVALVALRVNLAIAIADLKDLEDLRENQDIAIVVSVVLVAHRDPKVVADCQAVVDLRDAVALRDVAVNVVLVALKDPRAQRVNQDIATVVNVVPVDPKDAKVRRVNRVTAIAVSQDALDLADLRDLKDQRAQRVSQDIATPVDQDALDRVDLEDLRARRVNRVTAIAASQVVLDPVDPRVDPVNLVVRDLKVSQDARDLKVTPDALDLMVLRDLKDRTGILGAPDP